MAKKTRKIYRVKYRLAGETRHYYKYYTALDKSTAETMFLSGFRHTHGDTIDEALDFREIAVKRYGKWKAEE